jgi:hypothetical protein
MATVVLAILSGTPWWVWMLLAVLTGLGLQATRPRRAKLWRVLVTPLVFVAWGASSLARQADPTALAAWFAAAALGVLLGLAITRLDGVRADRALGLVELPGSWLPMIRNLAIFVARYGLAVAAVLSPAAHGSLLICDFAVSGVSAGYFVGWLVVFLRRWRRSSPGARAADAMVPR